ncbi:hypothetical protein E2C01_055775 [Portunus trituberculatus]|uniref:Uncharacterized protein n=1 Tax=Portunus trituberculatus TaxID=210409 RepID=A0A5B7GNL9_PORTR|nr:hypothetical protein [Portunus trituberculatus]
MSVWQVVEQTWHDSGQKCKVREIQEMKNSSTFHV